MRKTLIVLMLLLAACASQRDFERKTAGRLAGQVKQIQKDLGAIAASRTNIAIARNRISEDLLRSAIAAEKAHRDQLTKVSDAQRSELSSLLNASEETRKQEEKDNAEIAAAEALTKSAQGKIDVRSEQLGAAAKLLGKLSEKPSWKEQGKFYFNFFKEVKDSLDEMKETTEKNETAADAKGAELLDAATTTAGGAQ